MPGSECPTGRQRGAAVAVVDEGEDIFALDDVVLVAAVELVICRLRTKQARDVIRAKQLADSYVAACDAITARVLEIYAGQESIEPR
ncbi:hypothetical protein GCM10009577_77540 [Streptomyces javensis]